MQSGLKKMIKKIGILMLLLMPLQPAYGQDYRLVTGYLPPWSMANNSNYPGFFVEIMREADQRLGNKTKIETYPWGRAQKLAENNQNIILFPIARTPDREEKYSWIETIKPMRMVFVSLEEQVRDEAHARSLNRILVHKNAPPEFFLKQQGYQNLAKLPDLTQAIPRMLLFGRADAWFTPQDMAEWIWKLNTDVTPPKFSQAFSEHPLMIVGSRQLSPVVINQLEKVLQEMKADGTIDRIIKRYRR